MADPKEARVPDIGGHADVPVIEVMIKPGDTVEKDQSLITLESDKATMEVPAPFAGVVKEVKLKVGDEVSEGALIAIIEAVGAADSASPSPSRGEGRGEGQTSPQSPAPSSASASASPQPSPQGGERANAPQVKEEPAPIGGRSVLPGTYSITR